MADLWLIERLEDFGDSTALVWQDRQVSYAELCHAVDEVRRRLEGEGEVDGVPVGLEGDYSPRAVALLLALIEKRAVLVPLTKSVEVHREEFLDVAQVELTIQIDEHDHWKAERRDVPGTRHDLLQKLAERGHPGLVLFSSGSTGKNKASLHDLVPLLEKFQARRHRMVTLTFLLLDHIGGINTLFYTLANGGTIVSVRDRDPELVCRAIAQHRVELLPTTPTFLRLLLLSESYKRHDLSSLRRITYGTEVMPRSLLERIHELFPDLTLQQTYGLSELGILRSKSRSPDSLWVKVGGEGFETRVVDDILWIRARSAMLGYLNAPSPFDEDGWMNTEDVVEVDGEYLRILGRRSEIINVGGQKVYPSEVESVLGQMEGVEDVTVFGEAYPLTGHIVVARLNVQGTESRRELKKRVRAFCRDKLAAYKIPVKIEVAEFEQYSARFKKKRPGVASPEEGVPTL